MYPMVTGAMIVESRSIITTKRIEKMQKPQSCGVRSSSTRLCTVELIQRRRWESSTRQLSGAAVVHCASRTNVVLYEGKCLSTRVVRYRSSPRCSRFLVCSVSTRFSA